MKKLTLLATTLVLPGCSLFGEPVAEEVAPLINEYCERESYQARRLYRSTINAELNGHTLHVHCAGDPE